MKKVRSSVDVVVDSDRVAMDADHGTGMDSDVRDADVSSPSLPQEQGQCTAPSMGDGGTYAINGKYQKNRKGNKTPFHNDRTMVVINLDQHRDFIIMKMAVLFHLRIISYGRILTEAADRKGFRVMFYRHVIR
ncbi:hypothetical protein V6N13_134542 [Hibiscus sabdariffa]